MHAAVQERLVALDRDLAFLLAIGHAPAASSSACSVCETCGCQLQLGGIEARSRNVCRNCRSSFSASVPPRLEQAGA